MNIGLIGSGGREHSICKKLNDSKITKKIICFPGNAGTSKIASNIDINLENFEEIKNFILSEKIDLIIDLQSKLRNTLILKSIPHVNFYSTTFYNKFCSKKIKFASKNHLQNLKIFLDENIKLLNFNINQIPKKILNEADKLLPNKDYVGFSITQGNYYRKKSWIWRWLIKKYINLFLLEF